jgi:hypothetical protein
MTTNQPHEAWTVFVFGAALDDANAAAAALKYWASPPGRTATVQMIRDTVHDLVYIDGVGWVCPPCWDSSDHTDPGRLRYVETVSETWHISQDAASKASLRAYDSTTSDEGDDPRIECFGCTRRYAIPHDVEIDWG